MKAPGRSPLQRHRAHADLGLELAPHHIRVNVVHPTGVNTDMSNNEWFGRWLNEHEVSDDARYITGVEHRVDAGFMIK